MGISGTPDTGGPEGRQGPSVALTPFCPHVRLFPIGRVGAQGLIVKGGQYSHRTSSKLNLMFCHMTRIALGHPVLLSSAKLAMGMSNGCRWEQEDSEWGTGRRPASQLSLLHVPETVTAL